MNLINRPLLSRQSLLVVTHYHSPFTHYLLSGRCYDGSGVMKHFVNFKWIVAKKKKKKKEVCVFFIKLEKSSG